MALVKTDKTILSIRGSFGGVYFKKDNSGQHVQAKPRHVHNSFGGMGSVITGMAPFSKGDMTLSWSMGVAAWVFLILLGLTMPWVNWSEIFLYMEGEHPPQKLTGYNWFLHFNVIRCAKKKPTWWTPPKTPYNLPDGISTAIFPQLDHMNFYVAGFYNGDTYFKSHDGNWFNWWSGSSWIISPKLGEAEDPPYWYRLDPDPYGEYIGVESYLGLLSYSD